VGVRLRETLRAAAVASGLGAAWLVAAALGWPSRRALPLPGELWRAAIGEALLPALWLDAGATLLRVLSGTLLGALAGGALGALLGRRRAVWRAVEPSFDFLRAIPPILTFPVFLLSLGYGEATRIGTIAVGTGTVILLEVATALGRIPLARRDTVRLAGLFGLQAFLALELYEALPAFLVGLRLALQNGLVIAVVTEMLVGASSGLGARALSAQVSYRPELLWIAIALAGAVGVALSALVRMLERRLVHWPAVSS
jgi:ABC-type nitrate/sulfonate/bicarbonate transport system permease component